MTRGESIAVIAMIARDWKSKSNTLPLINADDTDLKKAKPFRRRLRR